MNKHSTCTFNDDAQLRMVKIEHIFWAFADISKWNTHVWSANICIVTIKTQTFVEKSLSFKLGLEIGLIECKKIRSQTETFFQHHKQLACSCQFFSFCHRKNSWHQILCLHQSLFVGLCIQINNPSIVPTQLSASI